MINEDGDMVEPRDVPDLVQALDQQKCQDHDGTVEDCHLCFDLAAAGLMLTVFDKLIALYNNDHHCLDPNNCRVCLTIGAYGLQLSEPEEEKNIVLLN